MDYMNEKTTKSLKMLEKELEKAYKDALQEASKQLEEVLFKLDLELTPQERLLKIREKDRLENLIMKMGDSIHTVNKQAINMINDEIVKAFINNQEYGAYLVETASAYPVDWTLYNKQTIKQVMTGKANVFYDLAIDEFKDQDIIRRALTRELVQGILLGEGVPKIAGRISNIVERNYNDSVRIARTETTRAENAGRLDSYNQAKKQGLKIMKKWSSTIDLRTRVSHQELNGQERELDEPFSNGLLHPAGDGSAKEVINCRCSMTVEFKGLEKTAKEKELDETLKNISFNTWKGERL